MRFEGELKNIDPKKLVSSDANNNLESFFLGLGVCFNDIKSLLLLEVTFRNLYEKPNNEEVTVHSGNFGGVIVYIQKLMASTINEFIIFIHKNNEIFKNQEFKKILNKIPRKNQEWWSNLVDAANNRNENTSKFLTSIKIIRSNISFHYDHSGKILKRGYISRFFNNPKEVKNIQAFYSIGDNFEKTRFFFADAAVEESLYLAVGKKSDESPVDNQSLIKYQQDILDTIQVIREVASSLLKNYISTRRNMH